MYEVTQDKTIFPRVAPKNFSNNKVKYLISGADKTAFQRDMGGRVYEKLNSLIDSGGYQSTSDETKAKMIKKVIDESYEFAKKKHVEKKGGKWKK